MRRRLQVPSVHEWEQKLLSRHGAWRKADVRSSEGAHPKRAAFTGEQPRRPVGTGGPAKRARDGGEQPEEQPEDAEFLWKVRQQERLERRCAPPWMDVSAA